VRRYEPHIVAQLHQLACPVVRRRTGFEANKGGLDSRKERHYVAAAKLPAHYGLALGIDPVDVEDVLRDIETDRHYLHRGSSRMVLTPDSGTYTAGAGAVRSINGVPHVRYARDRGGPLRTLGCGPARARRSQSHSPRARAYAPNRGARSRICRF
jgi:hypothetical protein